MAGYSKLTARAAVAAVLVGTLTPVVGGDDFLLLTNTEFDGLPAGIKKLDPDTGAILGFLVTEDWPDNGYLEPVEALAPGPNRTVLVAQPGGDGKVAQYDEFGNFLGNFIGGQPIQADNPVDNVRGIVRSLSGQFLFTADWTGDNVHRFHFFNGAPAPIADDPLGEFIPGQQPPPLLDQPQALEVLSNGDLLVADIAQNRLMRYDSTTGALIGPFTDEPIVAWVTDIDEQPNGDVIIAEGGAADRIRKFNAAGVWLSAFSFDGPEGVHLLPSGDYLVTSHSTFGQGKGLFRVSSAGAILQTIDNARSYGALELIPLGSLSGDCADPDGTIDLSDYAAWTACLQGPSDSLPSGCACADMDFDADVDLFDFGLFQSAMGD